MILEKNKEIQYMNTRLIFIRWVSDSHQITDLGSLLRRSIVLEISAFKFFGRGCSKIVCPKTCFLEQTFLGAASAIRILVLYKCRYKS